VKTFALAAVFLGAFVPAFAQTSGAPTPSNPPPLEEQIYPPMSQRWFFGGGVGLGFGDVDYVYVAPLLGLRVTPRIDVGVQPFYQWTEDDRYVESFSTTDYGAGLFTRIHIYKGLFAEADYQYTSFEYVTPTFDTIRDNHNAFLAGGGYSIPMSARAAMYFSALYDFTYDENEPYGQYYDSPWRIQVGVAFGF